MPALRSALGSALLISVVIGLVFPVAASAHPFGDPQRLEIATDGERSVRVHWLVGGTDDLTLLGIALGVLPEDRVMLDGAVTLQESDGPVLAGAPELVAYLEERITVAQDGEPCAAEASVADDLARDGAAIRYSCPMPVNRVSITARMLTDLHPAYRTMAEGPDGQRAAYDAEHQTADWSLRDGTGPIAATVSRGSAPEMSSARSAAFQLSLVGGLLLATAAAGTVWHRRGRRAD